MKNQTCASEKTKQKTSLKKNSEQSSQNVNEIEELDLNKLETRLIQCVSDNVLSVIKVYSIDLTDKVCSKLKSLRVYVKKCLIETTKFAFQSKVECIIYCTSSIKVYYSAGSWILENYVRHLNNHLKNQNCAKKNVSSVDVVESLEMVSRKRKLSQTNDHESFEIPSSSFNSGQNKKKKMISVEVINTTSSHRHHQSTKNFNLSSKWKNYKYSRSERTRRSLNRFDAKQVSLVNYINVLNEDKLLINENKNSHADLQNVTKNSD